MIAPENEADRPCLDSREGPLTEQAAAALNYRERGWRVGVHGRRVWLLAGQPCDGIRMHAWFGRKVLETLRGRPRSEQCVGPVFRAVGSHGRWVFLVRPCDDALRIMGWLAGELRVEHVTAAEPLDLPPSGATARARWITGPDYPVPRATRVAAVVLGIIIRGTR